MSNTDAFCGFYEGNPAHIAVSRRLYVLAHRAYSPGHPVTIPFPNTLLEASPKPAMLLIRSNPIVSGALYAPLHFPSSIQLLTP